MNINNKMLLPKEFHDKLVLQFVGSGTNLQKKIFPAWIRIPDIPAHSLVVRSTN